MYHKWLISTKKYAGIHSLSFFSNQVISSGEYYSKSSIQLKSSGQNIIWLTTQTFYIVKHSHKYVYTHTQ